MMKEKKQDQELILAKHLDGLKKNDFCDFEIPRKCTCQQEKIEFNKQSKEGGQPKLVCGKGRDAKQSQKL